MNKNILLIGCSFIRGTYSDEELDPNILDLRFGHMLYDTLTARGLKDFNIYDTSFFCNSVPTQCMILEQHLKHERVDYVVFQATVPNRIGLIIDIEKFMYTISNFAMIIDEDLTKGDDKTKRNYFTLRGKNNGGDVFGEIDKDLGGVWLNAGMIYHMIENNNNLFKWATETYSEYMLCHVGDIGNWYSTQSNLSLLLYSRKLLEKSKVPFKIFEWFGYDDCERLDTFDFSVKNEGILDNYWTDEGFHLGPKGQQNIIDNYLVDDIMKALT